VLTLEGGVVKHITVAILIFLIAATAAFSAWYFFLQPINTVRIAFAGVTLTVELAKTSAEQERGLSYRDSMPPDHGMLFLFDSEANWGFWMHEMRFPLDIIWFNSQRQAVYIQQSLQPCTPQNCPVFIPSAKAMYVLEVNAGFVESHDVTLGDAFTFLSQ
jgi:uncharacterized membrane protein (UPF0127 family)